MLSNDVETLQKYGRALIKSAKCLSIDSLQNLIQFFVNAKGIWFYLSYERNLRSTFMGWLSILDMSEIVFHKIFWRMILMTLCNALNINDDLNANDLTFFRYV